MTEGPITPKEQKYSLSELVLKQRDKIVRLQEEIKRFTECQTELITALSDAMRIIESDANTDDNYGSLCRIGSALTNCDNGQNCEHCEPEHGCKPAREMLDSREAVGYLGVEHFRGDPNMQNVDYEHWGGVLPEGRHKLYIQAGTPEGYVLVEKDITPVHVVKAGVDCLHALKKAQVVDAPSVAAAVFQDMLLATMKGPKK